MIYVRWDYGLLYILLVCLVAGTKVPRHESWMLLMPPLMTGLSDYVFEVLFFTTLSLVYLVTVTEV